MYSHHGSMQALAQQAEEVLSRESTRDGSSFDFGDMLWTWHTPSPSESLMASNAPSRNSSVHGSTHGASLLGLASLGQLESTRDPRPDQQPAPSRGGSMHGSEIWFWPSATSGCASRDASVHSSRGWLLLLHATRDSCGGAGSSRFSMSAHGGQHFTTPAAASASPARSMSAHGGSFFAGIRGRGASMFGPAELHA